MVMGSDSHTPANTTSDICVHTTVNLYLKHSTKYFSLKKIMRRVEWKFRLESERTVIKRRHSRLGRIQAAYELSSVDG